MAKVNFEDSFKIYLFTGKLEENNFSKLSEFLSFLKFNKINLPYKFSYVSRNAEGLIPELSLNENILMDFSPDSLTASKEVQFQEFLNEDHNAHLKELYQKIVFHHEVPDNADAQMKKVSSLIKSLIFEGQFIFLEEPEIDLDPESTKLFISALKDLMIRNKQNVFIFSHKLDLWISHVDIHVKREQDFSFSTEEISKDILWKKEREIFYNTQKTSAAKKEDLLFHISKSKKNAGKKSAA